MKNQTDDPKINIDSGKISLKIAIKASQEISQEIFKENLFIKILSLSSRLLNATKAILLLNENDSLNIKAIKSEIINEPVIVDSIPYTNSKDLSLSIIENTIDTKKLVSFNKNSNYNLINSCKYLKNQNVKSILSFSKPF